MKQIKWVESGLENFEKIVEYIAEEDDAAARRIAKKVREASKQLAKQPSMGRAGRVPGTRELIIHGTPYVIVYQVKTTIEILRVLHSAQKWPPEY